ncbi:transcriptional repressor [Mycobacterium phage MooMoo]|nr:transcriptional repressor [Mycobacterium phage MooMoo]AVO21647.1 hypothetical protein SEA_MOOMOO_42 [Mycobacterium phage MooMoo]
MVETNNEASHSSNVPTISELIRAELDTGKSVRDLEAASGYRVKFQTFQELSNRPPKQFPKEAKTIAGMATALNCTESAVVLAYASGLGIGVDATSDFALRLPPGVDDLAPDMKNALVSVVRAAVKQNGEINAQHVHQTSQPRTPRQTRSPEEDALGARSGETTGANEPSPASRTRQSLRLRRQASEERQH